MRQPFTADNLASSSAQLDERTRGAPSAPLRGRWYSASLLGVILVIATAGLVYELALATVASYLLGDTVTQFSLVIGVYLSALGIGAYLSKFFIADLTLTFVRLEFSTALLGGSSAIGLELCFSVGAPIRLLLLMSVLVIGVLVGLELPLLMRILESRMSFRELVARALGFDYAGALIGSIGFSIWMLPHWGLGRTTLICGLLNAFVGMLSTWLLNVESPREARELRHSRWVGAFIIALLSLALYHAESLARLGENQRYGRINEAIQSSYQRIVLTEHQDSLDLFLNGRLQFSSTDEQRYHEALVHPVLSAADGTRRVFVGGGGDGLAAREILKWPSVESITLVDIDPIMTHLAKTNTRLAQLNRRSLLDSRVTVINDDAMGYLERSKQRFDVILLDFPDPTQLALGKLYSTRFYSAVREHLEPGGAVGVQCTSPLLTRRSFWSIITTLEAVGLYVIPYRAFVPSFGDWGFAVARIEPFAYPSIPLSVRLKTLDDRSFAALTDMPFDTQRVSARANRLDDQALVATYSNEAARFEQ